MDASAIGFAPGETPFDKGGVMLSFAPMFSQLPQGVCGSGDSFLQSASPLPCDMADMEAYALAKVCALESLPFACVKYITDGADESAANDWQTNLRHAAEAFLALLKEHEKMAA